MSKVEYIECPASDVPAGVRFDVPARLQGQAIEIAYGGRASDRAEHDHGDPWMRRTDQSIAVGVPGRVTFYRRSGS